MVHRSCYQGKPNMSHNMLNPDMRNNVYGRSEVGKPNMVLRDLKVFDGCEVAFRADLHHNE
jgi:hypothetical protein